MSLELLARKRLGTHWAKYPVSRCRLKSFLRDLNVTFLHAPLSWFPFPEPVMHGTRVPVKYEYIWAALLVYSYLSNTTSSVFYSITCLIRLMEFAALFATFEETMC